MRRESCGEKREGEREEEEINGGGDLLEVIVVDEQQQQEQHPSHGGQFELEEECASEADLEEEMLEFQITPTKQDYADSFARPSDRFVQDFEDKATLSAKKTNETFKTPSKKESDRGEGSSRGSGAAVAAVAAAAVGRRRRLRYLLIRENYSRLAWVQRFPKNV